MRSPFLAIPFLLIMALGCGRKPTITGAGPAAPIALNETAALSIMFEGSADKHVIRWRPALGKCEARNELSCQYTPQAVGRDLVTVQALRGGRVVAETVIPITVIGSGGSPETNAADANADLEITVTRRPPFGPGGDEPKEPIEGKLLSAKNPEKLLVIVYAYAETIWYIQPERGSSTPADRNGRWETDTRLGSEYAILVVDSTFTNAPAQTHSLPHGPGVLKTLRLRDRK